MKVENLIQDSITKIVSDAGYSPIINSEFCRSHILCMTSNYDVHLQIIISHYEYETVISVWSWFEKEQDFSDWKSNLCEDEAATWTKQILNVGPKTFNIKSYIEHHLGEYEEEGEEEDNTTYEEPKVTAFFRILHDKGETYRNCFNEIRAALVGNVLASRNTA